jgi:long-chain acyl-CoA synthetase
VTTATTIGEVFHANASARPEKIAFEMANGRRRTFVELHRRVSRLVSALYASGHEQGDRVAILSKNSIEYFETYGVSSGGLIPVPLNWRLSPRELSTILTDCRPKTVIYNASFKDTIDAVRSLMPSQPHFVSFSDDIEYPSEYETLLAGGSEEKVSCQISSEDTACLLYTSGTTGKPKGAELTHRGLLANCRAAIGEALHLTDADISLAPMPFFHVGGMWYHLFPSFAAGCTTFILPEFKPAEVLDLIARHRITNVHLVPTMIHALLSQPTLQQTDLASLRLIFYAASTIPFELLRSATKAFSHCGFVQGYGSTEGGMISYLSEDDHRTTSAQDRQHLLLSCGKPFRDVDVRISAAGIGEIGEMLARSDMVMAGYWENAEATRLATADGWLHTGDLGRCDGEGYLYIVDRKSDMIVTGGENVYPREVEDVLFSHPAIAEVAVFDLPDEKWVQKVVAAVVLRDGFETTPQDIISHLKSQMASYKCPKEIFITNDLPKSGAGKVLRRILRERYSTSRSGEM